MTLGTCVQRFVLAAVLAAAGPALAATMSYMNDTPYSHFSKEDHKIFNAAVNDALEKGADGEAVSWSNPASSASGVLKPISTFERKGAPCRRLSIANKAKGRSASAEYNFCKNASGKWTLAN